MHVKKPASAHPRLHELQYRGRRHITRGRLMSGYPQQIDTANGASGGGKLRAKPPPVYAGRTATDELEDAPVVVGHPDLLQRPVPRDIRIEAGNSEHVHDCTGRVKLSEVLRQQYPPVSPHSFDDETVVLDGDVAVLGPGLPADQAGEWGDALICEDFQW